MYYDGSYIARPWASNPQSFKKKRARTRILFFQARHDLGLAAIAALFFPERADLLVWREISTLRRKARCNPSFIPHIQW